MPIDEHQALHDVAYTDALLKGLEAQKEGELPRPEGEVKAIEAQRTMETQLGTELQSMFDKLQPVAISTLPAEYDEQRLQIGINFLKDPSQPVEKKRIVREHLNDVLGRLGGVEFLKRPAQL